MDKINGDSTIEEVVTEIPDTIDVFMDFGIKPIVCGDPVWGTIREEAQKNNINLEKLLKELNRVSEK